MSISKKFLVIGLSSALLAVAPGAFAGSGSKNQISPNDYVGTGLISPNDYVGTGLRGKASPNDYVGTGLRSQSTPNDYVGTGLVNPNESVNTGLNSTQGVCSSADSNMLVQVFCQVFN